MLVNTRSSWNKRNMASLRIFRVNDEYQLLRLCRGDYVHSLLNYERALSCGDSAGESGSSEHQRICQAGIARSSVGSGDIRKGIALAIKSNDQALMKQCASLLEENKVQIFASIHVHKRVFKT